METRLANTRLRSRRWWLHTLEDLVMMSRSGHSSGCSTILTTSC